MTKDNRNAQCRQCPQHIHHQRDAAKQERRAKIERISRYGEHTGRHHLAGRLAGIRGLVETRKRAARRNDKAYADKDQRDAYRDEDLPEDSLRQGKW